MIYREERESVLQRARDEVVAAVTARDKRRATWCATQLLALTQSAYDAGNVVDDGVLVTDDDLAELSTDGNVDDVETQLPAEWDFPETRAWAICRITSSGGVNAFLALVQNGCEDYYDVRPGWPLVGVFETEKHARAALRALGYLDEADARDRYLCPRNSQADSPESMLVDFEARRKVTPAVH
jgi:hypothetical protein